MEVRGEFRTRYRENAVLGFQAGGVDILFQGSVIPRGFLLQNRASLGRKYRSQNKSHGHDGHKLSLVIMIDVQKLRVIRASKSEIKVIERLQCDSSRTRNTNNANLQHDEGIYLQFQPLKFDIVCSGLSIKSFSIWWWL